MTNSNIRPIYAALMRLSSEMARGVGMPSEHDEDHPWCKTTPEKERERVLAEAARANDQCRDWAIRLRVQIDKLSENRARAVVRGKAPLPEAEKLP